MPFQKIYLFGVLISIGLVLFGWILVPAESITGVIAALVALVLYGGAAWFTSKRLDKLHSSILSNAVIFGFIAGLIFTSEILLEYVLLPKDNTAYGLVEFGSVFFLYFLASLFTVYQTTKIRFGVLSAVGTAMIAALIWIIATLSVFYLFRGTPQQTQIFQAEGNYVDFVQSGMTDFNTFIIEDFMGAVFFHSTLGPLLASILGFIGGVIAKGILWFRSR